LVVFLKNIKRVKDILIDRYLILECIPIKDVNNLVARRHYEIIDLPASGPQAIIRLSGRLSHIGGKQTSINLLIKIQT